jgi:hypothetical protein
MLLSVSLQYLFTRIDPVIRVVIIIKKLKLKLSHYMPWRRLRERKYSSYSFSTSALDGASGQRHAPAALYSRGKDPWYQLYRSLSGPQSRSEHKG